MNHGKTEVSINFCPNCGLKFKSAIKGKKCNDFNHANRRKNRDTFCIDCGLKLSGV